MIRINSFMSWVGGKKALRDEALIRFPPAYERHVEVFGGAGWVLFHKPPDGFEVFNDRNRDLVNLYRCVRNEPDELIRHLTYTLNARDDFALAKREIAEFGENKAISNARRAALYYQIIRQSYGSALRSFGAIPHSMWANFPIIHQASARLQCVVIENKDFEGLIRVYDRPGTFFYADPPYYDAEGYYSGNIFGKGDHERLADALFGIEGLFLLSYNDCDAVRRIYSKPGIMIESLSRLNNLTQRYEGGGEYAELIIANYDTTQAAKRHAQLTLFPDMGAKDAREMRRIIHHG